MVNDASVQLAEACMADITIMFVVVAPAPCGRCRGQRCSARYTPADQLDNLVWQDLCAVPTHPEMMKFSLERSHGRHWAPQELQTQLELLKKASQQLERQQERLLKVYLADVVKLSEFERKRSELSRKQEALRIQSTQLQSKAVQRIEPSQIADSIELFCAKIRLVLEQSDFAQKRQLIEWLIDRVIVSNNNVGIRYVVPTHPDHPHIPFCQSRSDYRNPPIPIIKQYFQSVALTAVQFPLDCLNGNTDPPKSVV